MTQQMTDMTVKHELTVATPIERAFATFTERFDTWWPRSHSIGAADMDVAIVEPREGGRWFERGVDATECDWGRVLAWEPPHRVVLSWHIDCHWRYDPDPAHASEVEVRFTAEGPDRTRVELEHRNLERHGAEAAELREAVSSPGGWPGLLAMFAEAATA
ncbi:MAG: hypothetical protein JWN32_1127 [Solirubrobacterales bacterium]|jgi:uncharacterized protein YndB with AHSA1/START domain|nr:hypothetical protein [Solirubrobacterales bacterium]